MHWLHFKAARENTLKIITLSDKNICSFEFFARKEFVA